MRRLLFTIYSLFAVLSVMAGSVSFQGNSKRVINDKPAASTGLNDIFVLYNTNGVSMQYNASTTQPVKWYRFSNLGGGFAEEVAGIVTNGKTTTLSKVDSDMGYIIEEGNSRYYFWVVDYSRHYLDIDALNILPEQDCDRVALNVVGNAAAIKYYTINGQAKELSREIMLSYTTLAYDEETRVYNPIEATETYSSIGETIRAAAPLCNTEFELKGDRFLATWGEMLSVTSPFFAATSVAATTEATQTPREVANEKREETELGGSAPVEIEFYAAVTDAAIYTEWQFSRDSQFENITLRYNEPVITHTFRENGTTYVRFVAGNADATCEFFSDTYEVFIGESSIDCPNAFSPNSSEGTNDEWKVSYKSIISFECHIFNRWGVQVAELTDPSQGWDGKHGGKYVPSGVYYYVINATGADGRKYKLKGDINIINYKYNGSGSSSAQ
ncbi:MAG: gliding motility-associated C-terminal domain-containing protein [Muribaculaceae bacterium]|nr:gliding motility-associated C-terminal domain-containing protein [Muribaculaceae bacterium]